jgi:hypothetical protein
MTKVKKYQDDNKFENFKSFFLQIHRKYVLKCGLAILTYEHSS